MDLQYYVLGKESNSMLISYLERYYEKMLLCLNQIRDSGVLSDKIRVLLQRENKAFVINPDVSSLINLIYLETCLKIPQNLGSVENYTNVLGNEIDLFIQNQFDTLLMNKGVKIAGTEIRLTPLENNPFSFRDAHPDHKATGGVIGWGEATEAEWLSAYEKTFKILQKADRGIYDELNQIIKKIIPLGTARGLHNSASYKECIGHLYMGLTIDSQKPEMNNLEAIIHESSHNKLNLIMQFDPLVLNKIEETYYSPYRPDARHIHGIYLGVHAITATVYVLLNSYYQGLFGEDTFWLEKTILFHLKNKIGMKVLKKYLNPTPLGTDILNEMEYVINLSDTLIKKISPPTSILERALSREKQHFSEVNNRYSYLKY